MSVEENKAVIRRFFDEVFNHKQPELIEAFLADGVVDHNKIAFTEPDAPGGMAQGVRMFLVAFPDLQATLKHRVAEDDYVSAPRDGRHQHRFVPTGARAHGAAHRVGIDGSVPDGEW